MGYSLEPLALASYASPKPAQSTKHSLQTPTHKACRPNTTRAVQPRHFSGLAFPVSEPTKCSIKENGVVKGYAAATSQGNVRNYNEDRVSIILNIMKPPHRAHEEWPKCSFFGVYDGHGGTTCADFLRDNLHQYVIRNQYFPFAPKDALKSGFAAAEKAYLDKAERYSPVDRSGSCAIVALVVGEICYIANVGDSRAVMSGNSGGKIYSLSKDHKPSEDTERNRIVLNGGRVYQSAVQMQSSGAMLGPHRVFPGRLSVSRSFGDIEGKNPMYGGNPNVLIAAPEIKAFKISAEFDFIVLASDGVFDKMSNRETVQCAWSSLFENEANVHRQCGSAVDRIMKGALDRNTLDNITVVLVCFENFLRKFPGQ